MAANNINPLLDAGMIRALTRSGNILKTGAQENVGKQNLPKVISESMVLGQPQKNGDRYSIDVSIDVSPEGPAPMAAAFELGSGIHGEKREKYRIEPKRASVLAFDWEPEDGEPGRYFFSFVNHPGVAARPYFAPTVDEKENEIKEIIAREMLEVASIAFDLILE